MTKAPVTISEGDFSVSAPTVDEAIKAFRELKQRHIGAPLKPDYNALFGFSPSVPDNLAGHEDDGA